MLIEKTVVIKVRKVNNIIIFNSLKWVIKGKLIISGVKEDSNESNRIL
jgi:hypothetical protein